MCFEVLKLGTSLLNKYTCEETTVLLCTLCTSCLRFSYFKFIFIPSTSKQMKSGGFCCNNYVHLFDDMYVCFYVLQLSLFLSLNFLVLSVATEIETYVLQKYLVFRPMFIGNSKMWT